MASKGLYSQAGTCFNAAACTTTVTPARARCNRPGSRTSPIKYLRLTSSKPEERMSCCLSSSRLKITSRLGWYSRNMISTNFFPNEPVPPVTRTTCSDQFIKPGSIISVSASNKCWIVSPILRPRSREIVEPAAEYQFGIGTVQADDHDFSLG